jgi:hypothetical protein
MFSLAPAFMHTWTEVSESRTMFGGNLRILRLLLSVIKKEALPELGRNFTQSESDVRTEGTFRKGLRIADRACRPYAFALGLGFSRSVSVWLHTIRMPASFCSMEAIPVAHEETCETCKCRIVGVRNHRHGTFVDLCSAHFEMLAEHERAAYGAVESMPFSSDLP